MKMILAAGLTVLSLTSGAVAAPLHSQKVSHAVRLAYEIQKFGVYCIDDKISVEQWDLDQMKVRHGSNVCQLYENTSMSTAQRWADKNFPSHTCSCDPDR
jgi:hypothetical protein